MRETRSSKFRNHSTTSASDELSISPVGVARSLGGCVSCAVSAICSRTPSKSVIVDYSTSTLLLQSRPPLAIISITVAEQTLDSSFVGTELAVEEEKDLGFGSVVAGRSRERLLNPDGSFNVRRTGMSALSSLNL